MPNCKRLILIPIAWFTLILTMPACQTLKNDTNEEETANNLLETQKNVVIDYLNHGQGDLALKELRPLVAKYPQDVDFKNLLGLTYLSLQNFQMAQGLFEEAYRLDPKPHIALNLSSAYLENKQYARAMKLLKDLQASPQGKKYQYPERLQHNIGIIALRMNKPKLAEKHFLLALQYNPFYYLSLMQLGQLYEKTNRSQLALEQFEKARGACLKCYDPMHALVRQYLKRGERKTALMLLEEYMMYKEVEPLDRGKARKLLALAGRQNSPGDVSLRKPETTGDAGALPQ